MSDEQLNFLLTTAQQQTMIDMSNFDTKEQYMQLQSDSEQIVSRLKGLKSDLNTMTFAQGKRYTENFINS